MTKPVRLVTYPEGEFVFVVPHNVTHITHCEAKASDEACWVNFAGGKIQRVQGSAGYVTDKLFPPLD